jgi:DNA-binding MarR family transcriptional regulator
VKGGFIAKEQDTLDKRNIHLRLEKTGENALQEIETASYERITANLAKMEESRVSELLNLAEGLHLVLGVSEHVLK